MTSSVITNNAAYIALQSLNQTNSALQTTQNEISTGYRVSKATDDGAAFAIAQNVRSNVSALTTANQQLGFAKGLTNVTVSGLTDISNALNTARTVLTNLASSDVTGSERTQYQAQYATDLKQIKSDIQDTSYQGKTLVGNIAGSSGTFGSLSLIRNEVGSTYGVASFSGSAFFGSINFATLTSTSAAAALTAGGAFLNQQTVIGTQLNAYGAASNYLDSQQTFNNNKIDALNSGLGSLIDADLTKESAQLQSLQVRQQLGTQALSIANSAPQSLLSLFK